MFSNPHLDHQVLHTLHFLSGSMRTGHIQIPIAWRQHFKIRNVKKSGNAQQTQTWCIWDDNSANYLNSQSSCLVIFYHVELIYRTWRNASSQMDGKDIVFYQSLYGVQWTVPTYSPGGNSHLETWACLLVWYTQKHRILAPTRLQCLPMTFSFWSLSWSTRRLMMSFLLQPPKPFPGTCGIRVRRC